MAARTESVYLMNGPPSTSINDRHSNTLKAEFLKRVHDREVQLHAGQASRLPTFIEQECLQHLRNMPLDPIHLRRVGGRAAVAQHVKQVVGPEHTAPPLHLDPKPEAVMSSGALPHLRASSLAARPPDDALHALYAPTTSSAAYQDPACTRARTNAMLVERRARLVRRQVHVAERMDHMLAQSQAQAQAQARDAQACVGTVKLAATNFKATPFSWSQGRYTTYAEQFRAPQLDPLCSLPRRGGSKTANTTFYGGLMRSADEPHHAHSLRLRPFE